MFLTPQPCSCFEEFLNSPKSFGNCKRSLSGMNETAKNQHILMQASTEYVSVGETQLHTAPKGL